MRPSQSPLGSAGVALVAASALLWSVSAEAELSSEPADGAARVLEVNPDDPRKGTGEQLEQMHRIAKKMVCLCGDCPRYNLDECQCGWAQKNRRVIELALIEGRSDIEILEGYVTAYDLKVLDKLPDEGFGKVSYLAPYAVGVLLLGLTIWAGLRSRRKPETAPPAAGDAEREAEAILRRELEDLD